MFSKILRYGTIAAAIAGIYLMVQALQAQAKNQPVLGGDPPVMPPAKPFKQSVAATGILEALSENVAIGVPLPGLVTEVIVKVNDRVKKDQPLMKLDDRDLLAEQLSNKARRKSHAPRSSSVRRSSRSWSPSSSASTPSPTAAPSAGTS